MRDDPIQKAIGERLRLAAEEAGLSAPQIATALGMSVRTVYAWWNGTRRMSVEDRDRYLALTGHQAWFLYQLEDTSERRTAQLSEFIRQVLAGRPVRETILSAVGVDPGNDLVAEIEKDLATGRFPASEILTPEEHRQIADYLQQTRSRSRQGDGE